MGLKVHRCLGAKSLAGVVASPSAKAVIWRSMAWEGESGGFYFRVLVCLSLFGIDGELVWMFSNH